MSKVQLTPEQIEKKAKRLKKIKAIVDVCVSIGAAVVIIGALFKILHWPGANQVLIVGMFTEAAIFLIYAVLPTGETDEETTNNKTRGVISGTLDSTELRKALAEVKATIDNTNEKLGTINSSATGMATLNTKFEAIGQTLDNVNQYYGSVKNLTETMTDSVKEAARTKEQLTSLANNLEQLNALYGNMINAIKGK
jgi:ABC-type transporter Mla subunit MlaD